MNGNIGVAFAILMSQFKQVLEGLISGDLSFMGELRSPSGEIIKLEISLFEVSSSPSSIFS